MPKVSQRNGCAQGTSETDFIQTTNEFEGLRIPIPKRRLWSWVVIPPALVQLWPDGSPEIQILSESNCQIIALGYASGAYQSLYQCIRFCNECFVIQHGANHRNCFGDGLLQFVLCELPCRQNIRAQVRFQCNRPFGTVLDLNNIRQSLLGLNDLLDAFSEFFLLHVERLECAGAGIHLDKAVQTGAVNPND